MIADGWMEQLVLTMLDFLDIGKDRICEKISEMQAHFEFLVNNNEIITKIVHMASNFSDI